MEHSLARSWWLLALRGVLAIAFGVLVFLWPTLAWWFVLASFAAFALVDGVFAIAMAVTGHHPGRPWWALMIEGVLGISAGVLTLFLPGITELALLFLIAYWSIATGVFEVIAAIQLRNVIEGEWVLALSGILSVLFGVALALFPGAGAVAIAWLIGAYALTFGMLLLVLAFQLRRFARHGLPPKRVPVT
jgi:uncharacterized membrane protein HdeD (DUF308 family)